MAPAPHPLLDVKDRTGFDLGARFGSVAGKGIYISFQWENVTLRTTDPAKAGQRVRRLKIMKQPVGDPSSAAVSYITPEVAEKMFPLEWEHFNKTGDVPIQGTPLSELPGISQSQIQIMLLSGLRSVEDVLYVDKSRINQIGYEAQLVRSIAEEWKHKAEESQDMLSFAERSAAMKATQRAADAKVAALEAENAKMRGEIDALKSLVGVAHTATGSDNAEPITSNNGLPSFDDSYNPLADGDGEMDDDDPLN